jgi:cell division protein FtsN
MNKHTDSFSPRSAVEKVFAGIAAAAIVLFISAGTVAMCFPNIA